MGEVIELKKTKVWLDHIIREKSNPVQSYFMMMPMFPIMYMMPIVNFYMSMFTPFRRID